MLSAATSGEHCCDGELIQLEVSTQYVRVVRCSRLRHETSPTCQLDRVAGGFPGDAELKDRKRRAMPSVLSAISPSVPSERRQCASRAAGDIFRLGTVVVAITFRPLTVAHLARWLQQFWRDPQPTSCLSGCSGFVQSRECVVETCRVGTRQHPCSS